MAKLTKTVHVDVHFGYENTEAREAAAALVRTYGGRVSSEDFSSFICARVPRTRVSHFKGTATKKGIDVTVEVE